MQSIQALDEMIQNQPAYLQKISGLQRLIGNTPMLAIDYRYRGQQRTIYVKSEHYNLTGSIKDRMALYIIRKAYAEGALKPGDTIVEATSGNTGIAFSAIGRALGHRVKIIMPNWLSAERIAIIRSLGAEVILVSKEQGGFLGSIAMSEEMAKANPDIFLPRQFDNCYNTEAHAQSTGPEILRQLRQIHLYPDVFVAGVGTGGTVMGVGNFLKQVYPQIKVHPLEPAESPTMSTGYKVGSHRIQGISDEFIPSIVDLSQLDKIVQASDGDSILMAQKLAGQLGLGVGISSGANFLGAVLLQEKYGADKVVVSIFPDSNKKYLSTDLLREEKMKKSYTTPHIELLGFRALPA